MAYAGLFCPGCVGLFRRAEFKSDMLGLSAEECVEVGVGMYASSRKELMC